MLIFTWPMMLTVAGGVVALGVLALWRGERGRQWVSSTKLWAGLVDVAAGGKRRAIDPVWLMIFAGAVLGALAASGPGWRSGEVLPKVDVEWSVRSVGSGEPRLFVEASHGVVVEALRPPPSSVVVEVAGPLFDPPTCDDGQVVHMRVREGDRVVREAKFRRPVGGAFGLLTQTGRGLRIDPALWRVFAINPAAKPNDARTDRKVLLVNDPAFDITQVRDNTLVVATGQTRLPGVQLGEKMKVDGSVERMDVGGLPAFVRLDRVKIDQLQSATLSEDWAVLAKVDGRSWLAMRQLEPRDGNPGLSRSNGVTVIWLALQPSQDWAMDSSFPIFFADLLARTFSVGGGADAGRDIHEWAKEEMLVAWPAERVVGFSRWLGGLAIVLLLGGSVLLLRRAT